MGQIEKHDIFEIGSQLKSAQACIGLAAELLSQPDRLERFSDVEIFRFERQLRTTRNTLFPSGYFADVAWEVMVELFVANAEHRKLSIADLADRNKVPLSTLLRYLARMEADELIYRIPDHHDKRRVFIKLTPLAEERLKHAARATKAVLFAQAATDR